MLARCGMGMGTVALTALLGDSGNLEAATATGAVNPLAPKAPPLPAKAKRVLHLFMNGGARTSTLSIPSLRSRSSRGKPIPITLKTERRTGAAFPSPFTFRKFGQSGIEVSEIFSHVGECVDDLCIIRSMHTDIPNHEPSLMMMNCGEVRQVRPSFGSWITYGLGSENQNLPGFIVLCPDGLPTQGNQNWRSAFLPGAYQATHIDTRETQIDKLIENIRNRYTSQKGQREQLDLLAELNRGYRAATPERRAARSSDSVLRARLSHADGSRRRLRSSKEPEHITKMYGEGHAGAADDDRTPAAGTGSPLRAGVARRRSAVGQPRRYSLKPRTAGAGMRPAHRGPAEGPETARHAR